MKKEMGGWYTFPHYGPSVLKNLENSMNVIKKGFVNVAEEEILSIIRIAISFFHCRSYSEGYIYLIK